MSLLGAATPSLRQCWEMKDFHLPALSLCDMLPLHDRPGGWPAKWWVYGDAARTWVRRERESGCLTCPPEKIRGCVALSNVGYSIYFRVAGGLAVERGICAVGVASVAARCGIRRYVGLFQSRSARLSQRVYAYGAEPVRARDG